MARTQPAFDPAAEAVRYINAAPDEFQQAPENPSDTGLDETDGPASDGVIPIYFQHKYWNNFAMDYILTPGASNTMTMKIYGTHQTGVACDAAKYNDYTEGLTGEPSFVATGPTAIDGSIVDIDGLLKLCEYVKVEIVITGTGTTCSYSIEKNARL